MLNTWAHYYLKLSFKNDVQEHFEIHFENFSSTLKFAFFDFTLTFSVNSFVK